MEAGHIKLLQEIREMASGELARLTVKVMDQADDALFAMANKAETGELQGLYFYVMREVRLRRQAIEKACGQHFLTRFNEIIAAAVKEGGAEGELLPADSLGLVELDELEESLAVDNMVNKLRESAHEVLEALDLRFGYLLNPGQAKPVENPVAPDVLCRAFQEGCRRLDSAVEVKLIVLKLFDRYAFGDIVELYERLNGHLAARDILPELPAKRQPAEREEATDVFSQLQRLFGGGAAEEVGALGGGGVVPVGLVVADLTQLQRGGEAGGMFAGIGGAMVPVTDAGVPVNMLQTLRNSAALGSGTADSTTLDIVALMFDYILDDDALPDVVKAQLARLQIPMLKVALLDRSVFSDKGHPARALLDSLAAAGVGLRTDAPEDEPFLCRINGVVQRVLEEFEDDLALFEELLQGFHEFLTAELASAEATVTSVADEYANRERREIARGRAEQEVRRRLERPQVPVLIGQYFDQTWRRVLEQTAYEDGRGAGSWKLDVETMDILLWSLEPKATASQRRRLVGLLPELLRRLKDGAGRIGISREEHDAFISRLAPLHARAVRPPEEVGEGHGLPVIEDAPASVSAPPEPEPPAPVRKPDPEFLAIVGELDRGTWLEFDAADGGVTRARLSWVSGISGRYLFTDRRGFKVLDRGPEELAVELADGSARLIPDEPLFDRAVANLMDERAAAA